MIQVKNIDSQIKICTELIQQTKELPFRDKATLDHLKLRATAYIESVYGSESEHLQRLKSIGFAPQSFYSTSIEYKQSWNQGVREALNLFVHLYTDCGGSDQEILDMDIETYEAVKEESSNEIDVQTKRFKLVSDDDYTSDSLHKELYGDPDEKKDRKFSLLDGFRTNVDPKPNIKSNPIKLPTPEPTQKAPEEQQSNSEKIKEIRRQQKLKLKVQQQERLAKLKEVKEHQLRQQKRNAELKVIERQKAKIEREVKKREKLHVKRMKAEYRQEQRMERYQQFKNKLQVLAWPNISSKIQKRSIEIGQSLKESCLEVGDVFYNAYKSLKQRAMENYREHKQILENIKTEKTQRLNTMDEPKEEQQGQAKKEAEEQKADHPEPEPEQQAQQAQPAEEKKSEVKEEASKEVVEEKVQEEQEQDSQDAEKDQAQAESVEESEVAEEAKEEPQFVVRQPGEDKEYDSADFVPKLTDSVFVIHSNEQMKTKLFDVLKSLKVEIVFTRNQNNAQKSMAQISTEYSQIKFAIILLSADDKVYPKDDKPQNALTRSSQNIVFELGYWIGRLGRENVFVLYNELKSFRTPTEYFDAIYTLMDKEGNWIKELTKRLEQAEIRMYPKK